MEHSEETTRKNWRQYQQWMRGAVMILFLLLGQYGVAQTEAVFKLTQEQGHFFCETTLNGASAKVMVESGVPGLMMSEAFYEANKEALKMEVKECDEKIMYLGGMRHIIYSAQARLRMGGAIFEGPVKITREDDGLKMPIQMLRHPLDNSSIVRMDLGRQQFSLCSRNELQDSVKGASVFDLAYNQWGMPVVTTTLDLKADGRKARLTGKFITDMGNASLLFLNRNNTDMENLVRKGTLRLLDARDKATGKVVAQGIYAKKLTICDRTYKDVSVGVSTFKSLEECGFLGLKFFTMPAIFDFDENKLYLCR